MNLLMFLSTALNAFLIELEATPSILEDSQPHSGKLMTL